MWGRECGEGSVGDGVCSRKCGGGIAIVWGRNVGRECIGGSVWEGVYRRECIGGSI